MPAICYPSVMVETLTFKKIEKLYDSQWVLLADLQEDKYERIQRAKVLWHSPDKDEVSRKAVELEPGKFAFLYMGEKIPKDVAVIRKKRKTPDVEMRSEYDFDFSKSRPNRFA